MLSGNVNYYIHPRFYIGIWFSIIILILFALSLISKINKARHNVNVRHYVIFAIPLVASVLATVVLDLLVNDEMVSIVFCIYLILLKYQSHFVLWILHFEMRKRLLGMPVSPRRG